MTDLQISQFSMFLFTARYDLDLGIEIELEKFVKNTF